MYLLKKHSCLFCSELGTIQGVKAKIFVYHPRLSLTSSNRGLCHTLLRVGLRLNSIDLYKLKLLIRLVSTHHLLLSRQMETLVCGDYKVTANTVAMPEFSQLPGVDDLFTAFSGGTLFSKRDLSHAYQQLELNKKSKQYTTINTTKGLFQYQQLPFGISSASSIFQRTMESLMQGLLGVDIYIDDILVTAKTPEEHLRNIDQVMHRLEQAGATLKESKCTFAAPSVKYLGHIID